MSKARELAELSRTVADSADAVAITINSDEEVTFASGIDVTGTVTADGLTVDGDASISSANVRLRLFETDTTDLNTQLQNQAGDFFIKTIPDDASTSTNRFAIDHATGDISFYEDTGTTPKFVWDASAESLGIGTSSPSQLLELSGATAPAIRLNDTTYNQYAEISTANAGSLILKADVGNGGTGDTYIGFEVDATEAMRINASGHVGIGTSSPNEALHVYDATTNVLANFESGDSKAFISFKDSSTTNTDTVFLGADGNNLAFYAGSASSERMRIDSSGNVGIGTDSPSRALEVYGATAGVIAITSNSTDGISSLSFGDTADDNAGRVNYLNASDDMLFYTATAERMRIDAGGRVGIGTAAPTRELEVTGGGNVYIKATAQGATDSAGLELDNAGVVWLIQNDDTSSDALTFDRAGVEAMRIDSSGNVGIGTASPDARAHIVGDNTTSGVTLRIDGGADQTQRGILFDVSGNNFGFINIPSGSGGAMSFGTGGVNAAQERMRIDTSGNVGIGQSTPKTVLNASASTGAILTLESSDTTLTTNGVIGGIDFYANDGSTNGTGAKVNIKAIATSTAGTVTALTFGTSDSASATAVEAMRIDGSGNVGIGGASGKAWISSDANVGYFGGDSAQANHISFYDALDLVRIYTAGSERMRIDASGNLLVGKTAVPVGVLSGRQLVSSSSTGAEIIAYRDDNSVASGDFVGAHLIGNDDNSGTPDHFCGMWATVSSASGAMNLRFASQLGGYESGTYDMQINSSGSVNIAGALSKGSGSFRIDHPLPAKTETHDLVHSFVEAPQADNIYRGKVDLVGGSATVNIDTVAGMTEGTYVLLNTNTQCFTSNESGWTAVKGSVLGNTLTITAQESCTDTISWMVVGERKDQHMIDTDWTDDNGKVIVEPLKES